MRKSPVAGLQHNETGIAGHRPIMPDSCSFLATSPILSAHVAFTASADAPSGSLVQSFKPPSVRPDRLGSRPHSSPPPSSLPSTTPAAPSRLLFKLRLHKTPGDLAASVLVRRRPLRADAVQKP
ncbi:hypothetical protein CKAH01_04215 [Colletotrichum kahawae]|uniref:Uncharacterized protein n=1 Tax=Colletotrichum kahawae TaxID=34407 RepID=A0AAD9YKV5_COLKA|nr:hypothetical protein CKAH01_04215 [Colletotrichum kahawae]